MRDDRSLPRSLEGFIFNGDLARNIAMNNSSPLMRRAEIPSFRYAFPTPRRSLRAVNERVAHSRSSVSSRTEV